MWSKYPELQEELQYVESYISRYVHSRNRLLAGIISELVEAGGKRLRPAFVILSSKFGQYDREKTVSIAGAIEVLHTATLVHDDIIDRAQLRRGKATVSEKYGSDMAVYTGDFLFTKVILMLSKEIPLDLLETVARAVKTICEGEVDQYVDRFSLNTSILAYLRKINKKTAVLFGAACYLGASISGCDKKTVSSLAKFGFYYGMAFQIRDDLNDFLSDVKASGKPVTNDILRGIITLPAIYALRRSKETRELFEELMGKKDGMHADMVPELIELVRKSGGIEDSRATLERYIEKGIKSLEMLPENSHREILGDLIRMLNI